MMHASVDNAIAAIDDEIAGGFRRLRFGADLERLYADRIAGIRHRHLVLATIIGILTYDAFLLNDWILVPDALRVSLVCRLAIFTPLCVAGLLIAERGWSTAARERLCGAGCVLAVVLIMIIYSRSHSDHRAIYHYGASIVIIFTALVQRIRFHYNVLTLLLALTAIFVGLYASDALDSTAFTVGMSFHAAIVGLAIFAGYGLEREQRRAFLLAERGRLMNEKLDRAASIDPLTGLWNRRHLNATMAAAWAQSPSRTMAVILLDIDHFKRYNDTYGHLGGDECLLRIATCIRRALAPYGDMAVRFGGEEFLIFLPDAHRQIAETAALALRHAIHAEAVPYPALGDASIVTASIGVAVGAVRHITAAGLMAKADEALYEAKHAGRDCIRTSAAVAPGLQAAA